MNQGNIDITGLDKAEVLVALFNASKQQGMGLLDVNGREPLPLSKAKKLLEYENKYFDYLGGRVMKVDLGSDELDPRLYDRDNGEGAAATALADAQMTRAQKK